MLGAKRKAPLAAIAHLKKLSNHPLLVSAPRDDNDGGSGGGEYGEDGGGVCDDDCTWLGGSGGGAASGHGATAVAAAAACSVVDWSREEKVEGGRGKGGVVVPLPACVTGASLVGASHKLAVAVGLVDSLTARGHRVLVFSQSSRLLHLLAHCLDTKQVRKLRLFVCCLLRIGDGEKAVVCRCDGDHIRGRYR